MITDRQAPAGRRVQEPPGHGDATVRRAVHVRRTVVRIAAALAVAVVAALTAVVLVGHRAPGIGQTAGDFTLPAIRGGRPPVALADDAGRPVIINFFSSWSPPSTAETGLLAHFYRYYHGRVQIIGVDSRDNRSAALRLLSHARVTYPVASDPTLATGSRYGVAGLPTTYFLNARHQIVMIDPGWLSWKKLRAGVLAMDNG